MDLSIADTLNNKQIFHDRASDSGSKQSRVMKNFKCVIKPPWRSL